ncbi:MULTISPECIES: CYTH and CHAD domain-containing protein [unclassified Achromobacter]|uniref:CYTH and CHAD domain-containing protein n=1 Tax=unclassified Achromobacter TaxID=2626865 RepID=UPI000B51E158|nr:MULTISPECIES: CYTH and CHAD domain-containing protein [unclassified Achromobacter]OWT73811.1 inorganic triphosphatase [Achromobacter sp. HZ34]OWT79274.1 inorganic triphosphatase [Achromobacter sp. HZ28]
MSEQELKLHVPAAARKALEQEIKQRDASRVRLHAMYFDTPERELARARVAIRLRREGNVWVQTLKTPGNNAITRIELNHPRPGPILDLSVYAGTEVESTLACLKGELGLRYETDVTRLIRKVRNRFGTVEIAYDRGLLRAGALELPINEIEFELMSGKPAAMFTAARVYLKRHGLVMDARSKSERGDRLARLAHTLDGLHEDAARCAAIDEFWATTGARGVRLDAAMTAAQGLGEVAAECLDQITRNAAVLAEVDTDGVRNAGNPEHVHQLRVGIRRLRSAWRLYDGYAGLPPARLQEDVRGFFSAFGANRDQDVLQESIIPALIRAGMPTFPMEAPPPGAPSREIAASPEFQGWLLDMLEWSLDVPAAATGVAVGSGADLSAGAGDSVATGSSNGIAANGMTAGDDAAATLGLAGEDAAGGPASPAAYKAAQRAALQAAQAAGAVPAPIDWDSAHAPQIVPSIIPLVPPEQEAPPTLHDLLAKRLRKWHRRVLHEGQHFAELDIPTRHALRKRAKRLRYGLNFTESLLPSVKVRDYKNRLAAVQDVLGEMNDLSVAHDLYRQWSVQYPQAWFALGWISARQEELVAKAQHAFKQLAHAKAFWK